MSVVDPVGIVPESAWSKSSYSSGEGGECLEVAPWMGNTLVRDSKNTAGPIVSLGHNAWTDFVGFAAGHTG
ncbi:DUF397 domain-containing protein [Streptomyces sp. NPDC006290]|uniref:DUF397 domain-containing protein n=1 Tax=Streptomyces sp. NPDC006290 TaxID=3156745 RepID=UPI0033A7E666